MSIQNYINKVDFFETLPNEVLRLILFNVDGKTLGRCELLSKRWWHIINGTLLWNDFVRRDYDPAFDPNDLFSRGLQGKLKYCTEVNIRNKDGTVREIFLESFASFPSQLLIHWSVNSDIISSYGKIFSRYHFTPNGTLLSTYLQSQEIMTLPDDRVHIAALSSDNKLLIAGGNGTEENGWLSLWDGQGKLIKAWRGHESPISFVSFLPGDNEIISATLDKVAHIWPVSTDSPPLPTDLVNFSLLERADILYLSYEYFSNLKKIDSDIFSRLDKSTVNVSEAYYLPYNTAIIGMCNSRNRHCLWNPEGKLRATFRNGELKVAPDGRSLGIKHYDKISVYNYEGEKLYILHLTDVFPSEIMFAFSPNSKFLYYYSEWFLQIIDNNTGAILRKLNGVLHAEFSPDSTAIRVITAKGYHYIWDFVPGEDECVTSGNQLSSCTVM